MICECLLINFYCIRAMVFAPPRVKKLVTILSNMGNNQASPIGYGSLQTGMLFGRLFTGQSKRLIKKMDYTVGVRHLERQRHNGHCFRIASCRYKNNYRWSPRYQNNILTFLLKKKANTPSKRIGFSFLFYPELCQTILKSRPVIYTPRDFFSQILL